MIILEALFSYRTSVTVLISTGIARGDYPVTIGYKIAKTFFYMLYIYLIYYIIKLLGG